MHIRFNGFTAGTQGELYVVDMPSPEDDLTPDRTDVFGDDGQVAGPDYIRSSIWNITLLVDTRTYEDGMRVVRQVRDAWLDPAVRHSRDLAPLSYSRDGVNWHTVYGRPGNYGGPPQGVELNQGIAHIELQFEQLRIPHYSVETEGVSLAVAPGASGGIVAPVTLPIYMEASAGTSSRWGTNAGNLPSPVTIQFNGPLTDPVLTLEGAWRFAMSGTLAYDEYLVVDARAKTARIHSTTRTTTRSAFNWIRKGSRLSSLTMPPGQHAFTFEAVDPTQTASVDVSWPNTHNSMQ